MSKKHPKTQALAGLCLASAFLWPAALTAERIATEDFGDYPDGPLINPTTGVADINGGMGWAAPWDLTNTNAWWAPAAVTSTADGFVNDGDNLVLTGKALTNGGGRHQRFLETAVDSDVLWFSSVIEPLQENVEAQLWLAGGTVNPADDDPDLGDIITKVQTVAGVRLNALYVTYLDTSRATDELPFQYPENTPNEEKVEVGGAGEVWVRLQNEDESLYNWTGPILAVGKITFVADAQPTVEYFFFTEGSDTSDPANADFTVGPLTVAADRPDFVDGVAIFGVRPDSRYNHILMATSFSEVVRSYKCIAAAPEIRDGVDVADDTLDDAWLTNSVAYPVANFWADGDKNVEATDEADYGATAHVMWDATNLYVAVVVTDEEVRTGDTPDAVEIYLDGDNSDSVADDWPSNYDMMDDYQLVFSLDGTLSGTGFDWPNGTGNPDGYKGAKGENGQDFAGIDWQIITTQTGYILEASFNLEQVLGITEPMFDMPIGFDVAIVDRDDSGEVDEQQNPIIEKSHYFFCDTMNWNWQATANFGTVFLAPSELPIAEETFDYTVGEALAGNAGGTGFEGEWQVIWQPPWATGNPWDVVEGFSYPGDFDNSGNAIGPGGGGVRIARALSEARTSGVSFVSFTVDPGMGSMQAWLTNAQDADANDIIDNTNVGLLGGIRTNGNVHPVQIIAPTAENAETYMDLEGAYYEDPFVVVIAVLHDAGQLAYHIFGPANEVSSPADADYVEVVDLPEGMAATFDAFIFARFSSQTKIGPIRVGDGFNQVTPAMDADPHYTVAAYQVPANLDVTVDGMLEQAWAGSSAEPVTKFWADGGSNVMASSEADFSATAHMLWEDGMIYIAVPVNDEDIRDGETDPDAVEIYLDGDDSNSVPSGWPPAYDQVDDFQLVFKLSATAAEGATVTGSWFGNPTGNPAGYKGLKGANEGQDFEGITYAVTTSETGYILEVSIDTATVLGWTEGMKDLVGFDVAIADFDDTGEVDEEQNPIIEKSHYFVSDDSNWNWESTANFGTAYLLSPAPTWVDITESTMSVEAGGTSDSLGVLTNLQYVDWTAASNVAWITIDEGASGTGDGVVEYTVASNDGAASRTGRIEVMGKRLNITQAGAGNATIMALFPSAKFDTTLGAPWYDTPWFGVIGAADADLPWIWHLEHGWQFVDASGSAAGSIIAYDLGAGTWLWAGQNAYPWVYLYGDGAWAYYLEGTVAPRWFYIEGTGWTPIP